MFSHGAAWSCRHADLSWPLISWCRTARHHVGMMRRSSRSTVTISSGMSKAMGCSSRRGRLAMTPHWLPTPLILGKSGTCSRKSVTSTGCRRIGQIKHIFSAARAPLYRNRGKGYGETTAIEQGVSACQQEAGMPTEHPNVVLSRQHFDLMADQYDELFITHMHDYDITHEMILTMLPFPRGRALRVLELGTGTGNLTQKLLDRFPQSTVVG